MQLHLDILIQICQFDYEIGGLQFRAVCWTEFEEYVAPQLKSIGDEDDDD